MPGRQPLLRKTHITTERPPFERIALILQGGGALGAYQAGIYQALAEANLHPDWVAGISIGAVTVRLGPPEQVSRSPIEGMPPNVWQGDLRSVAAAGPSTDSQNSDGSRHFIGTRPGTL